LANSRKVSSQETRNYSLTIMSEIKNLGLQIRMFILIYLKGMHQTFLYPTIISGIMLLYLNQWMLVFFISWLFLCFYCVGISKFGRVFCYYYFFFKDSLLFTKKQTLHVLILNS